MERTESTVIQVAPAYENEKIQEMEGFGWNLHGRQEIREEGDAIGKVVGSDYVVKTKVKHYVKLHLTRSQSLPNLDRLRQLEAEYSNLPFPKVASFTVPGCFSLFGAAGIVFCLAMIGEKGSPGLFGVVMYLVWTGIGILWIMSRRKKRAISQAAVDSSRSRMAQIRQQAANLL